MDFFETLSKEEIKLNRRLLAAFEREKVMAVKHREKEPIKEVKSTKLVAKPKSPKKLIVKDIDNEYSKLFKIGYDQLNDFQKPIVQECDEKQSGGLSLVVGSGKTIVSLVLALYQNMENEQPILVIVSKSLMDTWETEIEKFYGTQLTYKVIHPSVTDIGKWKIKTPIILTTVDVLAKYYKENSIDKLFIKQVFPPRFGNYVNHYNNIKEPYLNHVIGGGLFYSIQWGTIIIDEAQT